MHLEIDNLHFEGERMAVDFEYDEDFRRSVAKICGVNYISKKDLQEFVVHAMKHVLSQEDINGLRKELEE
jgi:hypothetical protein